MLAAREHADAGGEHLVARLARGQRDGELELVDPVGPAAAVQPHRLLVDPHAARQPVGRRRRDLAQGRDLGARGRPQRQRHVGARSTQARRLDPDDRFDGAGPEGQGRVVKRGDGERAHVHVLGRTRLASSTSRVRSLAVGATAASDR